MYDARMQLADSHSQYRDPLIERYASRQMATIFSDRTKFGLWRRIWLALAETEQELGLSIRDEQLAELRQNLDNIDFAVVEAEERRRRHDVMAHVYAFGLVAPLARPILHLGATSADIGDNADCLMIRSGLRLVARRIADVLVALADFAQTHRALACLGATHLQAAQPTTVGKRACLWAQDFLLDLEAITAQACTLPFRGIKGTTGTQASFLELFDGDHEKVRALDQRFTARLGFSHSIAVSGQTYTRKLDTQVLSALAGIGESASKFAADVRILQAFGELAEPFGKEQTGSSAMAYKRNPMRCERIASLSRYLLGLPAGSAQTAANQWLERTLDDSAIRRIILPHAFLAADAILLLLREVIKGLEVFPRIISRRLRTELPFMATEGILMEGVKAGGDRQELHEAIRAHSQESARRIKEDGAENDLLERIAMDPRFARVVPLLQELCEPRRYIGRASEQVDEFLSMRLQPALTDFSARSAAWGGVAEAAEIQV